MLFPFCKYESRYEKGRMKHVIGASYSKETAFMIGRIKYHCLPSLLLKSQFKVANLAQMGSAKTAFPAASTPVYSHLVPNNSCKAHSYIV